MKNIPSLFLVTALAFFACDSKEERDRKAILENRADSLDDQAKTTKKNAERAASATEDSKKELDRKAEAIRIEGERKADQLKEAAKETREQK
jgi:hypothetical protein